MRNGPFHRIAEDDNKLHVGEQGGNSLRNKRIEEIQRRGFKSFLLRGNVFCEREMRPVPCLPLFIRIDFRGEASVKKMDFFAVGWPDLRMLTQIVVQA